MGADGNGQQEFRPCALSLDDRQAAARAAQEIVKSTFNAAVNAAACAATAGAAPELSAMQDLISIAEQIAAQLVARKQTIAVAESSTGGLISAALLAVPGASAYFLGSAV